MWFYIKKTTIYRLGVLVEMLWQLENIDLTLDNSFSSELK